MQRTNTSEPQCRRRVRRPWDIQRLFEFPSSQCIVVHGLQGREREPCKEKGLPSLLLASWCNRRILLKCRSEDWGAVLSYTDVQLNSLRKLLGGRTTLKRKKKFFVFFNLIVVRTWRPDLLTSSERYSMAFYLRGRATCSSHPLPVVLLLFLLGWPELPPESFAEEMRDRRGE